MAKVRTVYRCHQCDYQSPSYLGRCPECEAWGSFAELKIDPKPEAALPIREIKRVSIARQHGITAASLSLDSVTAEASERVSSGFPELDRVLGGGIMPGSYILI